MILIMLKNKYSWFRFFTDTLFSNWIVGTFCSPFGTQPRKMVECNYYFTMKKRWFVLLKPSWRKLTKRLVDRSASSISICHKNSWLSAAYTILNEVLCWRKSIFWNWNNAFVFLALYLLLDFKQVRTVGFKTTELGDWSREVPQDCWDNKVLVFAL